ncbi:MAG TPA: hypothetical protein VF941_22575, partial [Clostridia bacterium]
MELLFLNPPVLSSLENRQKRAEIAIDIFRKRTVNNEDRHDNRFKYWIDLHRDMAEELSVENLLRFQSHNILGPSITGGSGKQFLDMIAKEYGYDKLNYFMRNHAETICGEPKDLVMESGAYTTVTSMRHIYHLSRLHELCHMNFVSPVDFWEIGGGFGNLARIVCQYNLCDKYYIVDHPVMHTIQYFFLSEFLPLDEIAVVSEKGEYLSGSKDSKVHLCSSFNTGILKQYMNTRHVLVSTMALTEIPNVHQNEYLELFNPDFIYIFGQLHITSVAGGKSAGDLCFSNSGL